MMVHGRRMDFFSTEKRMHFLERCIERMREENAILVHMISMLPREFRAPFEKEGYVFSEPPIEDHDDE